MKRIYVDLDGVLNKYKGDYDPEFIPEPADGVKDFLKTLSKDYMIFIFTARNKKLTQKWLKQFNLDEYISGITDTKDGAHVYVDDRALCFKGNFNELVEQIKTFSPWYK